MEPPDKSALSKELWGTDDYKEIRKILTENDKNAAAEWKKLKNKPVERFTKLKLPYYAPEDSIPQSLPTIRDIEKARATPLCHEFNQFKTYRVNDVFVVKFSATPAVIQVSLTLKKPSVTNAVLFRKLKICCFSNNTNRCSRYRNCTRHFPIKEEIR